MFWKRQKPVPEAEKPVPEPEAETPLPPLPESAIITDVHVVLSAEISRLLEKLKILQEDYKCMSKLYYRECKDCNYYKDQLRIYKEAVELSKQIRRND